MSIFYLILWSILAGFIGSLVGLGGGLIVTPVLTIFFGVDIKYAIGASIIAVIATSSGSAIAFVKDGISNIKIGLFLEIFTTVGGIIGALLSGIFSSKLLYIFFSIILLNSFYGMLKKSGIIKKFKVKNEFVENDKYSKKFEFSSSYYDKAEKKEVSYNVTNVEKGSLVMFGAGMASGLLGIGSGAFKVIALDDYMKLPLKVSTATSNFMMGVTACASALIYFFNGTINPFIAAPVAIGTLIGSRFGAKVMQKINAKYIRLIFLPILLFTIINMFLKGLGLL
ncbi:MULTISPECIES: sulfite exporter TauE/SafE family protein [unclassified Gemella]|uniref:sulfite exporter TauE/SafE family protein n=1 Tax=unclassified Gemella TaxID=2624949 RepID=UPI001C04ED20|nr:MULTISPECIES: sulfite exporter TauE/SafE family protein [unclassified Gemella]MBU0278835.1 sulfite exporter TauE/SafE family protein [Gemella sp. zg-1178]QWQ39382.1 sulfite exporter TauE/SafE family protein [Gemella sp. zg-570]